MHEFMRKLSLLFSLVLLVAWSNINITAAGPERPNILWITAEDINPNLGCYGDAYASTPNLDEMAAKGVRYTRCFATAPVCSPARSCLITGLYATSMATQNLRSHFPIPARFKGYPEYLRDVGYFTSNNAKTDYNTSNEPALIKASWNQCGPQAHWRQRKPGQPFFSVFNLMTTHQSRSSAWSFDEFEEMISKELKPGERHDPAKALVPPYYPDTPTVRRTLARYADCITAADKQTGNLLAELEKDGLADDTIIFFYGDNGAGIPRGKRLLYDTGLYEPLIIYFPKKYQHLAPAKPGVVLDRLVSFVDFAPSLLSLLGMPIPEPMQGQPFLGRSMAVPRTFVYGARDRVDEALDLSRSVRDGRYLYIRNYMPHLSWNQPEGFSDTSDMRQEITRLAAEGKLNAAQLTYAGPRKPMECLYDTEKDPHQINNLAETPSEQARLEKMRRLHSQWIMETRDLGFLPEPEVWRRLAKDTPYEMARDAARYPLEKIMAAADLVGRLEAVTRQIELLENSDPAVRYWAAVGLNATGKQAATARNALLKATQDEIPCVRIEAAAALAKMDDLPTALKVLVAELKANQPENVLHAARSIQLMRADARPVLQDLKSVLASTLKRKDAAPHGLFIKFSLAAAIAQLTGERQ